MVSSVYVESESPADERVAQSMWLLPPSVCCSRSEDRLAGPRQSVPALQSVVVGLEGRLSPP